MKLAICTDVFADLSYTEMLDKVKSLGIDAVEMTAGGWGARKHCNTKELLADGDKLAAFQEELDKRGMRISALIRKESRRNWKKWRSRHSVQRHSNFLYWEMQIMLSSRQRNPMYPQRPKYRILQRIILVL